MVVQTKQTCRHYSSSKNKPYNIKFWLKRSKVDLYIFHNSKSCHLNNWAHISRVKFTIFFMENCANHSQKFNSQIKSSTQKDNFINATDLLICPRRLELVNFEQWYNSPLSWMPSLMLSLTLTCELSFNQEKKRLLASLNTLWNTPYSHPLPPPPGFLPNPVLERIFTYRFSTLPWRKPNVWKTKCW